MTSNDEERIPVTHNGLPESRPPRFMTVRQVAEYLQVNEKKIYALVGEGKVPASKVTGKWLFPRDLVDRWILESSHGGLLTDRLLMAGSDDPLLFGPDLVDEFELARTAMGLDDAALAGLARNAFDHSGAPEALKEAGRAAIAAWLGA